MDTTWSLGAIIGFPIGLLIIGASAVSLLFGLGWRKAYNDPYGDAVGRNAWWVASAVALLAAVVLTTLSMYPFKAEYHQWRTVDGDVTKVSSRILKDGDSGVTQRFVVRFADGNEYACDDTRCSTIAEGDHLTLSCKRAWQYTGRDGYDCNYLNNDPKES